MSVLNSDFHHQNRERLQRLQNKTQQACPEGWIKTEFAIGGLTEIGFSKKYPEQLLVISSSGRGLVDCNKMELIHRDYTPAGAWLNETKLWSKGIGPVAEEEIQIAGLAGGGLPHANAKGDCLVYFALNWPIVSIIFQPSYLSVYNDEDAAGCYTVISDYEIRSYGFSFDGRFFVVASSSTLHLFKKVD